MNSHEIKNKILELTNARYPKTICPSEVLPKELKQDKTSMQIVREVARTLADEGKILITQKNQIIDHQNIKGPIRLKKNEDY